MSKVFDFLHATNEVLAERGVELPLPGADAVNAMYANAPDDEQHLQRLLSANCFGDHYTRNGLDIRTRELLTLATWPAKPTPAPAPPGPADAAPPGTSARESSTYWMP